MGDGSEGTASGTMAETKRTTRSLSVPRTHWGDGGGSRKWKDAKGEKEKTELNATRNIHSHFTGLFCQPKDTFRAFSP